MNEETKFCFKCGNKIPLNAEFCPVCGANKRKQDREQNMQQQPNLSTQTNVNVEPKKTSTLTTWGWISAVAALFIPLTAIASFILGAKIIKYGKTNAGVVLIVFAAVFMFLGMTGFAEGFFGGF